VDEFTLRVFQSEVLLQCNFVLRAARLLDDWGQNPLGYDAQTRAALELAETARGERLAAAERGDWDVMREHATRETAAKSRVPLMTDPTTGAWFALQDILISAANISKLCWGSSKNANKQKRLEADRLRLRRSISISKRSPLYSRNLRNGFEHFDEELEKLGKPGGPRGYVGRNIGSPLIAGVSQHQRYGEYDPTTGIVKFWRRQASIPRIVTEARRIEPIVRAKVFEPF
jgi:hypothetical protein